MWILFIVLSLTAHAKSGDAPPIANFRPVVPGIFAGANPIAKSHAGLDYLKSIGVKTVLNLQGADVDGTLSGHISNMIHFGERLHWIEVERCRLQERGIGFRNTPIRSRRPWGNSDRNSVREALDLLAVADESHPVYLHCQRGIDRTGLIIALYRIERLGWIPENAYEAWQASGRKSLDRMVTAALDDYFCEFALSSSKVE